MHFGVTGCFGGFEGLTLAERVSLLREAEDLGFESIWLNEEHFVPEDRYCYAPIPLASYLAGVTDKLRLGFSVLQLPFHDPLRLAEDLSTLDVLSNGRVEIGISRSGNQSYHTGFGIPMDERTDRFNEALQCMMAFWTSETKVTHDGKFFHYKDVVLTPKPIQRPHPPIHIAARDPASVRRVASLGHRLIGGPVQALTYMEDDIAAFRAASAEVGRTIGPEDISFGRYVFVAETEAKAREEGERVIAGLTHYFHHSGHLQRGFVVDESQLTPEIFERELIVVGSPDTVARKIDDIRQTVGCGRFTCNLGITGLASPEQISRSLRLLGREVLPRFAT